MGGLLASLIAGDGVKLRASGIIGTIVGAIIVLAIGRSGARASPRIRSRPTRVPIPFLESRAEAVADIVLFGAVPRPTPDSGAHAAGQAGAKGASSPRDAGRVLPFPAGRRERESRGRRHERSTR